MPELIHSTDDVFGVTRDLPLNYVERKGVDDKFIDSLARKKHIVIFGSSKQGKTSLRKKCLLEDDYVVVSCHNKWSLGELHAAVLKECGFEVRQSTEKTAGGQNKLAVGIKAKGKFPWLAQLGGNVAKEKQTEQSETSTFAPIELDPADANDVIRALDGIGFSRYIVLEDFHYLPDDTQQDFAFSLKTFHENSKLTFIIIGVWREENRLIGYNGDLTDRVLSVDVDTWSGESLREVIDVGGALLNVSFDDDFVTSLLKQCYDSVHIVQETCRRACRNAGVYETQGDLKKIGDAAEVRELVSAVVADQAGRYRGFLMGFADGFQETELQMPRWIIYAILCCSNEDLENGVRLRTISKLIKAQHPSGTALNNGNITQILKTASSLQNKKGTRPLVIDYDTANTSLHIVDKGFLIWLAAQDVEELANDLDLPKPMPLEDD